MPLNEKIDQLASKKTLYKQLEFLFLKIYIFWIKSRVIV